jgi:hypothetical protein
VPKVRKETGDPAIPSFLTDRGPLAGNTVEQGY